MTPEQELYERLLDKMAQDPDTVNILTTTDALLVAYPYQVPPDLSTYPAYILLRPEETIPETEDSQGGVKRQTIYFDVRSLRKENVWDLKARILAVLQDIGTAFESGASLLRMRHDWCLGPYLNPDGKTWEAQIRFIAWYHS